MQVPASVQRDEPIRGHLNAPQSQHVGKLLPHSQWSCHPCDVVEPAAEFDGAAEVADDDEQLIRRPADNETAADHQRGDESVATGSVDGGTGNLRRLSKNSTACTHTNSEEGEVLKEF